MDAKIAFLLFSLVKLLESFYRIDDFTDLVMIISLLKWKAHALLLYCSLDTGILGVSEYFFKVANLNI